MMTGVARGNQSEKVCLCFLLSVAVAKREKICDKNSFAKSTLDKYFMHLFEVGPCSHTQSVNRSEWVLLRLEIGRAHGSDLIVVFGVFRVNTIGD